MLGSHTDLDSLARCVTNAVWLAFAWQPERSTKWPRARAATATICQRHAPNEASRCADHAANLDCSLLPHRGEAKQSP